MKLLKPIFIIFLSFFFFNFLNYNINRSDKVDAKESSALQQYSYDNRMDSYDVKFYHIDLEVTDTSTWMKGFTTITVKIIATSVDEIVFDFSSYMNIDSVLINNKKENFEHKNNLLVIDPAETFNKDAFVTCTVFYAGYGKRNEYFSGVYNAYNTRWNKRLTWTLSEPFSALSWFPCKQVLADKADSAYIFITTDKGLKAGANGILVNEKIMPGNKIRYEWKTNYPIAYYLLSFAAGDYYDYSFYAPLPDIDDSVLIQNYIYDTLAFLEHYKKDIDTTADLLYLYSEFFGIYPFYKEKYGHCIVPSGGGMEHQTMTTLSSFYFLLVAHELAHQWFGDYVTCATWQDIWINEGFASYAEYIACQYMQSQDAADSWMFEAHDYIKSQSGGSVYVPEDLATDEERVFDYRLSYKKGAAIIHMIRHEVQNDSLFFAVLRDFLSEYKNNVATAEDFRHILEEKTKINFSAFFDQWYYGEGFPSLNINWKHQHDTLYISSFLTTSSNVTPLFNILTDYKITLNNYDTIITHRQTANYDVWKVYLPGNVRNIKVDPNKWLLLNIDSINNLSSLSREERFYVTPNPAKNKISIFYDDPSFEGPVYLIDASGRITLVKETDVFPLELNISQLNSGSYFVLIKDSSFFYTSKFIKL
jgi:aminopeptidase N